MWLFIMSNFKCSLLLSCGGQKQTAGIGCCSYTYQPGFTPFSNQGPRPPHSEGTEIATCESAEPSDSPETYQTCYYAMKSTCQVLSRPLATLLKPFQQLVNTV
ncbi:insulin-like growth factor-binding protein-like 1 [Platysternon megacephalum]|uniref:Insulin-like growth factor-binding protein-like 1 n=1 Tax=Platysternon megacephalum TaxID=55544 RepID=A0A4D9EBY8_9SAUR|nr:insulin-like growth factor-binding protein-like 1 [Platysternon megacephalum]